MVEHATIIDMDLRSRSRDTAAMIWRTYDRAVKRIAGFVLFGLTCFAFIIMIAVGFSQLGFWSVSHQSEDSYQPAQDATVPHRRVAGETRPQYYDPACEAPVSRDDSDLCAQWSAVEAVNESNRLVRASLWVGATTIVLSALGTIALVWTLWETRATARRELRAYVSYRLHPVSGTVTKNNLVATPSFYNTGQTPAFNFSMGVRVRIGDPQEPESFFEMTIPDDDSVSRGTLAAGRDTAFTQKIELNKDQKSKVESGEKHIYVFGAALYEDAFGRERKTSFRHRLCKEKGLDRFTVMSRGHFMT